jgi:hypothetical protein
VDIQIHAFLTSALVSGRVVRSKSTNVSEEHIASIFRVKEKGRQETIVKKAAELPIKGLHSVMSS